MYLWFLPQINLFFFFKNSMVLTSNSVTKTLGEKNEVEKRKRKKILSFPHRESNPGHGGESAGS